MAKRPRSDRGYFVPKTSDIDTVSEALGGVEERRRLIVEILRRDIITNIKELGAAISKATGRPAPHARTLQNDLQTVGVVRVNLGNGIWRYRTADLITLDDVRLGLQDRLSADGLVCEYWAEGVVLRTTKGTAAATAGLLKMMIDYDLDVNLKWVMHDGDDTILMAIYPKTARETYRATFRDWMRGRA